MFPALVLSAEDLNPLFILDLEGQAKFGSVCTCK